jgi:adenylylsulfate kinase
MRLRLRTFLRVRGGGEWTGGAYYAGRRTVSVNRQGRKAGTLNGHPSYCVWLTGLPGAGKSTIARGVEARLIAGGIRACVLDGDAMRKGLCRDLGFSRSDRAENVRRVAQVARILVDAGVVVVTALISPYRDDRRKARELFGPDEFVEAFVRCPVEVCERRDPKGLYQKARTGELSRFTGISDPYEGPDSPDLVVDTGALDEDAATGRVMAFLAGRFYSREVHPGA